LNLVALFYKLPYSLSYLFPMFLIFLLHGDNLALSVKRRPDRRSTHDAGENYQSKSRVSTFLKELRYQDNYEAINDCGARRNDTISG
jgi:hypothetical protein